MAWKRILQALCIRDHAPLRTFPFNDMDQGQLEYAALRPYLFMKRISTSDMPYIRETIIRFPSPSQTPQFERILQVLCLPGGRFALTISTTGWVVAWDLSAIYSKTLIGRPQNISAIKLEGVIAPLFVVPTQENAKYRVIIKHSRAIDIGCVRK